MLKKELRETYRKKRTELSAEELQEYSQKIRFLLLQLMSKLNFIHVNCFLTSTEKHEVQTNAIIEDFWNKKKEVSVPYSNYNTLEIKAAEFNEGTKLELDQHQILQPVNPFFATLSSIDVVIVPLLCFNQDGFRIGYGKGMYDRFLSQCKPDVITIGLSLFETCEEDWEIDQFDIPLNYVISPEMIYTFGKEAFPDRIKK